MVINTINPSGVINQLNAIKRGPPIVCNKPNQVGSPTSSQSVAGERDVHRLDDASISICQMEAAGTGRARGHEEGSVSR